MYISMYVNSAFICFQSCSEEVPVAFGSTASLMTLRNEHASLTSLSPATDSRSPVGSPSSGEPELQLQHLNEGEKSTTTHTTAEPLSCKDSAKDSESIISSGMSSLCNSPPLNSHRLSKYSDRYDAVTLKLLSTRLDESLRDAASLNSNSGSLCLGRMGSRSVSASLTNVSNYFYFCSMLYLQHSLITCRAATLRQRAWLAQLPYAQPAIRRSPRRNRTARNYWRDLVPNSRLVIKRSLRWTIMITM